MADCRLPVQAHKISGNLTISSYEPGRAGKPAAGGLRPSPWGCLTAPPICSHMGGCFLATKPLWVSTPHLSNGLMVPRQRQVRQGGSKPKCSDISLFTHLHLGQKQGEGLGAGGQIPAPALFPPTVPLPSWGDGAQPRCWWRGHLGESYWDPSGSRKILCTEGHSQGH